MTIELHRLAVNRERVNDGSEFRVYAGFILKNSGIQRLNAAMKNSFIYNWIREFDTMKSGPRAGKKYRTLSSTANAPLWSSRGGHEQTHFYARTGFLLIKFLQAE